MGSAPAHLLGTIIMKFLWLWQQLMLSSSLLLYQALSTCTKLYQVPPISLIDPFLTMMSYSMTASTSTQSKCLVCLQSMPLLQLRPRRRRDAEDEVDYEVEEKEDQEVDPAYLGV